MRCHGNEYAWPTDFISFFIQWDVLFAVCKVSIKNQCQINKLYFPLKGYFNLQRQRLFQVKTWLSPFQNNIYNSQHCKVIHPISGLHNFVNHGQRTWTPIHDFQKIDKLYTTGTCLSHTGDTNKYISMYKWFTISYQRGKVTVVSQSIFRLNSTGTGQAFLPSKRMVRNMGILWNDPT